MPPRDLARWLTWILALLVSVQSVHADDTAQGLAVLHQMMADRPAMKSFTDQNGERHALSDNDRIVITAAALLACDGPAGPVSWSKDEPDKVLELADHVIATKTESTTIRLSKLAKASGAVKDQPATFEMLWNGLIYELFNCQNDPGFMDVYRGALKGSFSESEFVEANTRMEYVAEAKLADFYQNVFIPWASANHYKPDPRLWVTYVSPAYEQWIGQYTDPKGYPWDYWGHYYEEWIVPYLKDHKIPVPKRRSSVVPNSAAVEGVASPPPAPAGK